MNVNLAFGMWYSVCRIGYTVAVKGKRLVSNNTPICCGIQTVLYWY